MITRHDKYSRAICRGSVLLGTACRNCERCRLEMQKLAARDKGVVYISGPMTGYVDFNYPAFHAAAERWRRAGWKVLNPAENFGGRTDLPYETCLREDIHQLLAATAIAMLPGWQQSRGAKLELLVAQTLGLAVYYAEVPGQPFIYCPKIETVVAR